MADSEDHIALAAEYALGTLDAEERAQVETMMAMDKEFTALVETWEFRLGPLNQMVGLVEPRPIVWENIRSAIGQSSAPQAPLALPLEAAPPPPPPVEPAVVEQARVQQVEVVDDGRVVQLTSRLRRWRGVASAVSAIAAALLVMLGLQVYRPDSLPEAIRPTPRTQIVEVKTPPAPPSGQYVAVLQQDGNSPAFILTVDAATRNFTVRRVGATEEPGKSFELWLISDKLSQPRSLGVIGADEFTERPVLSSFDAATINDATYAVTVEPAGGSPTGAPTSAPIFSGKLIESVPPPNR
jgi:anti-sigma-K factor RskA